MQQLFRPTVKAIITGQLQHRVKGVSKGWLLYFLAGHSVLPLKIISVLSRKVTCRNKFQDSSKIGKKQENKEEHREQSKKTAKWEKKDQSRLRRGIWKYSIT